MSGAAIVRAADYRRMPWKNGGGETAEIAISPERSGLDDFDWRLSMATVATNGPFSAFPGIDRTLCVLDGAGIRLSVEGLDEILLSPGSQPFAFAADRATFGHLIDGPVVDFNVMSRRDRMAHTVSRHVLVEPALIDLGDDISAVFVRDGRVEVETRGDRVSLRPRDTWVWVDGRERLSLRPECQAEILIVELSRVT